MTTETTPPDPDPQGPTPPETPAAPIDPAVYDSPRNVRARAKGLDAPFITGGEDPDPGPGLAEERRLGRLLVLMVVGIVVGGFVIGTVIALIQSG